jgi:hypothetical protein
MRKALFVLVAGLFLLGVSNADAAIGIGGGYSSGAGGICASADIGIAGPLSVYGEFAFSPIIGVGGGVLYKLPALADGKMTPYVGGGVDYWMNYLGLGTTGFNFLFAGGKGGIQYKLADNIAVYGGAGYMIAVMTPAGWPAGWLVGGLTYEFGVHYLLVP